MQVHSDEVTVEWFACTRRIAMRIHANGVHAERQEPGTRGSVLDTADAVSMR